MTASRRAPSPVPCSTPRGSNQFFLSYHNRRYCAEGITLTYVSWASCTFHELTLFLGVPSLPEPVPRFRGFLPWFGASFSSDPVETVTDDSISAGESKCYLVGLFLIVINHIPIQSLCLLFDVEPANSPVRRSASCPSRSEIRTGLVLLRCEEPLRYC